MDQDTLRTLLELFGGGLILPIIGILKHFTAGTWIDDYIRWEVITGLLLIAVTFVVCHFWVPLMPISEIIRTGLAVGGGTSIIYGGKKTVDAIRNQSQGVTP